MAIINMEGCIAPFTCFSIIGGDADSTPTANQPGARLRTDMPNTHLVDFHGSRFDIVQYPVLKCVGMLSDEQSWLAPVHSHDDVTEVLFVMSGEGSVKTATGNYPLHSGSLAIYNPGIVHQESWRAARRGPEMFHMKLSDFKLCDMPDNCILPPGHAPVIDTGTYSPLLEQIFRTMFDECSRRDAGYEQLCHNLMGSALIVILRLINRDQISAKPETESEEAQCDSLALRARSYIEKNYMRKVTVRDIADELHISYYHLSHVFKQEMNLSPQDYLISYRMNEACRLLTDTRMSMSEIAACVGYGNQSHFNVQFKTLKGVSPGQYRRIYSEGGKPDAADNT